MNWLEHEYLIPVIVGNGKSELALADKIKRKTGIRVNIFAERFSFFQRLKYSCHIVTPMKNEFLLNSLISFADALDSFDFPVIVSNIRELSDLLGDGLDRVECSYIIGDPKDLDF